MLQRGWNEKPWGRLLFRKKNSECAQLTSTKIYPQKHYKQMLWTSLLHGTQKAHHMKEYFWWMWRGLGSVKPLTQVQVIFFRWRYGHFWREDFMHSQRRHWGKIWSKFERKRNGCGDFKESQEIWRRFITSLWWREETRESYIYLWLISPRIRA